METKNKIMKLGDFQGYLWGTTSFLFVSPILTTLLGWHQISTYLFIAFWMFFGMSVLMSALVLMKNKKNTNKTSRFFYWILALSGIGLMLIGFGIAEYEPILLLLFSLPVVRFLSSRSLADILNDPPGAKAPWLDHLSDACFILSAVFFTLMFFGFFSEIMTALMLLGLGLSLILDQVHFGLNHKNWPRAAGLMIVATGVLVLPGLIILVPA